MTIRLHLTRDSVAAGDDFNAPHRRSMTVPLSLSDADAVRTIIEKIVESRYLPGASMAGTASWAAFSNLPLAVISNVPPELSVFWHMDDEIQRDLDLRGDGLHIYFAYLKMAPPAIAFDVLESCISTWR